MQLRTYSFTPHERTITTIEYMEDYHNLQCSIEGESYNQYNREPLNAPHHRLIKGWLASKPIGVFLENFCDNRVLSIDNIVRANQWIVIFCVFCCVIFAKALTSSWAAATGAGVVVLSRGDLIARVGELTPDTYIMALLTVWFLANILYFRTGSYASLATVLILSLLGAILDEVFLFIAFGQPLLILLGYFLRKKLKTNQEKRKYKEKEKRISIFKTFDESFFHWFYKFPKRKPILIISVLTFFLSIGVILAFYKVILSQYELGFVKQIISFDRQFFKILFNDGLLLWLGQFKDIIDIHLIMSLGVIGVYTLQKPYKTQNSLTETCWLFSLCFILAIVFSFITNGIDIYVQDLLLEKIKGAYLRFTTRNVIIWFEPILLTLGVICSYHLIYQAYRYSKIKS